MSYVLYITSFGFRLDSTHCEMITTISLVTIHHHTSLIFRIYSHGNFQVFSTISLTMVYMLYITPPGFFVITESLYLLTLFTKLKLLNSKGNHKQNEKTTHRMEENIVNDVINKGLFPKYTNSSCSLISNPPPKKIGRRFK